jgi:hypothetical protein
VYHGAAVRSVRTRLFPAAAVLGLAIAGTLMVLRGIQDSSTPVVAVPAQSTPPIALTVPHPIAEFAIAPDGQRLAFSVADSRGTRRLWVRSIGLADERPLPGTDDASYPFWSSDSRFIAYFAGGALRKIAAEGGAPAVIAAAAGSGGAWHGDVILFAADRLHRVPAGGGTVMPVTAPADGEAAHSRPVFLPDGERFLYTVTQADGGSRIALGSLASPERREVLSNASGVAVADGYIVFIRNHALHVQPFDVDLLTPRGDPIQVSDGAPSEPGSDGVRAFSLSAQGILAYQRGPAVTSAAGESKIDAPVTLVDWRSTAQR